MQLSSPLTLAGRTAVVTGGSRNVGLAIADKFAKCGMKVDILVWLVDHREFIALRDRFAAHRCVIDTRGILQGAAPRT